MSDGLKKARDDGRLNKKVIVDFADYQDVFDALVAQAREQMRDPAKQALWILRGALEKKNIDISE